MVTIKHKQISLLFLYVAQSIPMSFFSSMLPVIMREEHFSLESIGLLQLIKLPWIFKLFWAPVVDKTSSSLSDYKRWIIGSELFYALVIASISFFSLDTNFNLIVGMMVLAFIASATQDIATDALSIKLLPKTERSLGASMQSMGSFIGTMIGGGALLIIYRTLGWQALLLCLSVFVLIALVPVLLYKQKLSTETVSLKSSKKRIEYTAIFTFFKQHNIYKHIFFLLLYYAAIIATLAMLRPYMVDLGYSVPEIGILVGVFGTATATICSFMSGFLIRKWGKEKCRIAISFFTLFVAINMYLTSFNPSELRLLIAILCIWANYGMATVVVYNIAMDRVREGLEGTDFTLQTVLTHLSGLILAAISGQIAGKFDYSMLFVFSLVMASISLFYNIFYFKSDVQIHTK